MRPIVLRRSTILLFSLLLASPLAAQELEVQFHGQIDLDWSGLGDDDLLGASGFDDGAELRRTRLILEGSGWQRVDFRLAVDFDLDAEEAELNNLWVQLTDLPAFGRLRVGYFREPFGLERNTPSRRLTFMERSPAAALTPNRNFGLVIANTLGAESLHWTAGVFRESDVSPGHADRILKNATHVTGRLTYVPWLEDDGRRLLHVGASVSRRGTHEGAVNFAEAMPLHLSPDFVDTGDLASDALTMLGLEAATVLGPWSLQGEWLQTSVDLDGGSRATLPGFYVQASYFLTGESRSYKASRAHFGWPLVRNPLQLPSASLEAAHSGLRGFGAWEIATRYAQIDFNSGVVHGGELATTSLGLNWYCNDFVKAQLDYELARLADVGTVHGVAMRLEFIW